MVEYQNWYQVLRPIGSFVNERSRVEILKMPDESDLRLREKVRSMPFGLNADRSADTVIREALVLERQSEKSFNDTSAKVSKSYEDIAMSTNLKKRVESNTYLSPRLKQFQDQEKEIKSIFWNLLKTDDLKCPEDIDVDAIRDFLNKRDEELGRIQPEETELDVFDKYGLGIQAQKLSGSPEGDGNRRPRGARIDSLLNMLDKMVEERTTPIPKGEDRYEKNNPITGKVGFRRDEMGGPREYTDLDERLDFGDLDKDVDFGKFFLKKGRVRIDSRGNFTMLDDDDEKANETSSGGDEIKKIHKKKGRKGTDEDSAATDKDSKRDRKFRKDKSTQGRPRSASETMRYLDDLKKSRRYPEWDFPMCNYPKWVHRMYRMDQEKIGQLIKQGMGVPDYYPPWITQVLDRVWTTKDASMRGEKPSDIRGSMLKGQASTSGMVADEPGKDEKTARDGDVRKLRVKGERQDEEGQEMDARDGRVDGKVDEEGPKSSFFGMDDFMQGYEKEMVDLAKLDSESNIGGVRRLDDKFDMNDLVAEYETQLQREENISTGVEERNKRLTEEKARKTKEKQEAAKKNIVAQRDKHLRDKRLKLKDLKDELLPTSSLAGQLKHKQNRLGSKKSTGNVWKSAATGFYNQKKIHGKPKKIAAVTQLCTDLKGLSRDRTFDEECMRRFAVLLQDRNKVIPQDEFMEIAKRISLFQYEKAPPPKTPCERATHPIC